MLPLGGLRSLDLSFFARAQDHLVHEPLSDSPLLISRAGLTAPDILRRDSIGSSP
jgi:hypothetical protein